MPGKDILGMPVESYKMRTGVPPLLGKIRDTQKKIKQFQLFKTVLASKIKMMDEQLIGQGRQLLSMMPTDPMRDLQGMDFPTEPEDTEQTQMRY